MTDLEKLKAEVEALRKAVDALLAMVEVGNTGQAWWKIPPHKP